MVNAQLATVKVARADEGEGGEGGSAWSKKKKR